MNQCKHLDEIVSVEMETCKEHLTNHKWYHHIQNDDIALSDFINCYGQYMREVYCSSICLDRFDCEIACKEYNIEPHDNEAINISLRKFYNEYIKRKRKS